MFDPQLAIGQILSENEVYRVFHCQPFKGIRVGMNGKVIVIVSGATKKKTYNDIWEGDTLLYNGMDVGSDENGNQTLSSARSNNNLKLYNTWKNPESADIFLFVKREGNKCIYMGPVHLKKEPFLAPRHDDPTRKVWIFPLQLMNSAEKPLQVNEGTACQPPETRVLTGNERISNKSTIWEELTMVEYQIKYPNIANLKKPEWAFNFWILENLFSVEEELIEEKIVDYNDKGIDCFVWHEELRDLYLIQNKYYSEGTPLSSDYILNDFLSRPLSALKNNTYTRSKELQDIYNKFSSDEDFAIHFHLYVTNNTAITPSLQNEIALFNQKNAVDGVDARLFGLAPLKDLYYQEPTVDKKSFKYTMRTINRGTELRINNAAYKLTLALDAKYVLTPVTTIYHMYKAALAQGYPIFDANIREYLGSTGIVNKKIVQTLRDSSDRANFFFYNNGITMIVSDLGSGSQHNGILEYDVIDPQIVNGCQTVSAIYETLSSLPETSLETAFANTFVMVKILKIPADDAGLKGLYQNIVTYNNSQNSINEKDFTKRQDVFRHVQQEFEGRGLLVCIKQSDKNKYLTTYKVATPLLNANNSLMTRFGITGKSKTKDFIIELETLLQVFLTFISNPQDAVQKKARLLIDQSQQNNLVVDFIRNQALTNDLVSLYMLYLRAEQEKNKENTDHILNPFYFIYCISRYDCKGDTSKIAGLVETPDSINKLVKKYSVTIALYFRKWSETHTDCGYNDMIKSPIDLALLDDCKASAETLLQYSS